MSLFCAFPSTLFRNRDDVPSTWQLFEEVEKVKGDRARDAMETSKVKKCLGGCAFGHHIPPKALSS